MRSTSLILALIFVASVRSEIKTEWVQAGETTNLTCPMKNEHCLWYFNGKTYENSTKVGNECVYEASESEVGKWTCLSADDYEVELKLANVNGDVTLELPKNYANFTADSKINATCKVDESEPKPTFSWFIGETELEPFELEDFSQTVELVLNRENANKTLKCVVDYGKTFKLSMEDSIVLAYFYNETTGPSVIPAEIVDWVKQGALPAIVCVVAVVLAVVLAVGVCYKSKWGCFKLTETDAEKGEKDTEKVELTEKDNEESDEQVAKPNLKARMASFFKVNKGFTADDEKTEETKENGDVKENGDAKIDLNDVEKDTEEKVAEEKETDEDKVIVEKEKKGKSYRSFIAKMFKRDTVSDKEGEEPVKMQNEQEDTEDKTEEKKVVEEENTSTEPAEEEKKEPTPNTSF